MELGSVAEMFLRQHDRTFALTQNNELWSWPREQQNPVPEKELDNVAIIKETSHLFFAITTNRDLYSLRNIGNGLARRIPTKIMSNVLDVTSNHSAAAVLTYDGDVYISGENYTHIMEDVRAIYGGSSRACILAITNDNTLWSIERNNIGTLAEREFIYTPKKILDDIKTVAKGTYFGKLAAIGIDGSLWVWESRTGYAPDEIPRKVMDNAAQVFLRSEATFVLTTDDELWGWGSNRAGSLGDGTTTVREEPVHIISNVKSVARSSGWLFAVITHDNVLWAWGVNPDNSRVGEIVTNRFGPVRVLEDVVYATDIYAITSDGTLWQWFERYHW